MNGDSHRLKQSKRRRKPDLPPAECVSGEDGVHTIDVNGLLQFM
jgi:hypothetical protein